MTDHSSESLVDRVRDAIWAEICRQADDPDRSFPLMAGNWVGTDEPGLIDGEVDLMRVAWAAIAAIQAVGDD